MRESVDLTILKFFVISVSVEPAIFGQELKMIADTRGGLTRASSLVSGVECWFVKSAHLS